MKKKLLITLFLVLAFFTGFHFLIANSEGVRVATEYLGSNVEVIKVVGSISHTSLVPLASDLKDFGSEGTATYFIKIVGDQGKAEGVVTSVKSNGKWRVIRANLVKDDNSVVTLKE